ncbi:MAG TPA: alanine racemase [Acidobacteriaceae bacterium]|nr:alanine racemase [Acidobacteriaceae bacterium]
MHTRPIWAEISRSRLISNYQKLQAFAGPYTDQMAVVKGDAYGHGIALCASWLAAAGTTWLGVTSVEEGVVVRDAVRAISPQARILVMCGVLAGEEDALLDSALTPTIWEARHLELLAHAASRRRLSPGSIPIHLEIDSGMSRQGVVAAPQALSPILDRIRATPALHLEGVFTHFASAEVLDAAQNQEQLRNFAQAVRMVAAAGFQPAWVHGGNSATLLRRQMRDPLAELARSQSARLLMRPGIALYGYALPIADADGSSEQALPVALEPVLCWKARIVSLRSVEAGTAVGYNATFIAPRDLRLALLPVGYADGLNRKLSNKGHVLVRGSLAPIIGRVSMDLTVVDVTNILDVDIGEEVVLIGEQADPVGKLARVTAADHARWADTIPYEILCNLNTRVPRIGVE